MTETPGAFVAQCLEEYKAVLALVEETSDEVEQEDVSAECENEDSAQ